MAAGMGANVVCAFAISFSVPYLLGAEHANLGPKVSYKTCLVRVEIHAEHIVYG